MTAKKINDQEFRSGLVRLSYPSLHVPRPKKDDKGQVVLDAAGQPVTQFTAVFIIPKTEKDTVAMLKSSMQSAAKAMFGERIPPKAFKGLRDGDTDETALIDPSDPSKGSKPELAGCYWINCTSQRMPKVIDKGKDEFTGDFKVLGQNDIKAGDWVFAQIRCYAFDKGVNKGVAFSFAAVQLREEGEALAAGGFNASAFEDDEVADAFA